MVIDHIGIVVRHIEEGLGRWKSLFGYTQATEPVTNTRQRIRVVFMTKKDSCMVKLIEPVDEKSPIYNFARKGGGFHHICFKCDSVESTVARLKALGLHVLCEPQPGEAFENHTIAFAYANQGLNIELIDTDQKAKWIDSSHKERPSLGAV